MLKPMPLSSVCTVICKHIKRLSIFDVTKFQVLFILVYFYFFVFTAHEGVGTPGSYHTVLLSLTRGDSWSPPPLNTWQKQIHHHNTRQKPPKCFSTHHLTYTRRIMIQEVHVSFPQGYKMCACVWSYCIFMNSRV